MCFIYIFLWTNKNDDDDDEKLILDTDPDQSQNLINNWSLAEGLSFHKNKIWFKSFNSIVQNQIQIISPKL